MVKTGLIKGVVIKPLSSSKASPLSRATLLGRKNSKSANFSIKVSREGKKSETAYVRCTSKVIKSSSRTGQGVRHTL